MPVDRYIDDLRAKIAAAESAAPREPASVDEPRPAPPAEPPPVVLRPEPAAAPARALLTAATPAPPARRPIYRKWWFWTATASLAAAAAVAIGVGVTQGQPTEQSFQVRAR